MAIAPAARLMNPEPRYVTTTPTAIAAIVAPVEAEQEEEEYLVHVAPGN